jgi:hypothetical protein
MQTHAITLRLALLLASLSPTLHAQTSQPAPATQPNWLALTVAPDTTLLTGPLRPDGTVDYVAALNQIYSQGITPENNAFVALVPAIDGQHDMPASMYAKALELAGAKEPKGTFYPLQAPHRLTLKEANDYVAACLPLQSKPWTATDHPDLDRLVNLDKDALDAVHPAVQRSRFWFPLVSRDESLIGTEIPPLMRIQDIGTMLRIRAMRSLGSGDAPAAWHDLLDVHQMAHLLTQDSEILSIYVAARIDNGTFRADWALIANPNSDSTLLTKMSADLQCLSPLPPRAEVARRRSIYIFPDSVRPLAQQVKATFEQSTLANSPAKTDQSMKAASLVLPDWDHMLRYGNPIYAEVLSEHTWKNAAERSRYLRDFDHRIVAMHTEASGGFEDNTKAVIQRPGESQAAYSERLARLLISLLVPSPDDRDLATAQKSLEFTILACAIERYRLDKGVYPASPADLVPKYIAAVPQDFYHRPLDYSHNENGFKISSLGPSNDNPQKDAEFKGSRIAIDIHR